MPYLVWNILERQGVLGDWEIHTNDDTPTVAVNFGLETGPSGDRFRQRFIWVKVQHFQCGQTLIFGTLWAYGTLVFFGSTIFGTQIFGPFAHC